MENYYLSSTENTKLEYVRNCSYLRELKFSTGKKAVVALLDSTVQWEDENGFHGSDKIILTARYENYDIFEIKEFPVFVYVSVLKTQDYDYVDTIESKDLIVLGIGELYRTYDEAKNHKFD